MAKSRQMKAALNVVAQIAKAEAERELETRRLYSELRSWEELTHNLYRTLTGNELEGVRPASDLRIQLRNVVAAKIKQDKAEGWEALASRIGARQELTKEKERLGADA